MGGAGAGARRPPGVLVPPPPVGAVRETVEHIAFIPLAYYRAGKVYVEHGTQYEPLNAFGNFLRPTLPPDDEPERIELPLGSLVVRYALNRLEAIALLFENIRPITAGFGMLVRQHLWLTIRTVFEHAGPLSTAIVNTLELHGRDTSRAHAQSEEAAANETAANVQATYPDSLPPEAAADILGLRSQPALSRANSLMISAGGLAGLLLLAAVALALIYLVTASLSRAFDLRAFLAALGLGVSGLLSVVVLARAGRGVHRREEGAARIGWLVAVILLGASALRLALSLADVFNQRGGPGARLLALNLLALAGALAARALLRDILYGRLRRLRVHWRSHEQLNWVERWLYAIGLVERRLTTGFARIAFGRSGLAVLQLCLVALVGVTVLGFVAGSAAGGLLNTVCILAGLAVSIFSGAAWGRRAMALAIGLLAGPLLAQPPAAPEAGSGWLSVWEALAALALAGASLAALLYGALRYAGRRGEATVQRRYLVAAMHRVSEALSKRGLHVPYFIAGHDHNLGAHAYPSGQTYLNTGCWLPIYARSTFSEQHAGKSHRVLRLGFAQVEGLDGDDVRARLYVWDDARRVVEPFENQS